VQVGLLEILLEVDLVGLPEHLPVDVPDVVPLHVRPVLGELDGDALVRRAVHACGEAFDDETGAQIETADPREGARVEVLAIIGDGFGHRVLLAPVVTWLRPACWKVALAAHARDVADVNEIKRVGADDKECAAALRQEDEVAILHFQRSPVGEMDRERLERLSPSHPSHVVNGHRPSEITPPAGRA
jgi:hypothetical protein